MRLWNPNTGEHLRTLTGHTGGVLSVSFSPDGSALASGSDDKTVRLWDANTGEHLRTLTGHTGSVFSVSFSPDGSALASGSVDGTVRLWDAETGEHLRTLTGHTAWVYSVSFNPDGTALASGSWDGTILLWKLKLATTWGTVKRMEVTDGSVHLRHLSPSANVPVPATTNLLPNYPNPFNPETWLPYHLANDADVTITIYDTKGELIRLLHLGSQPAGFYTGRGHAAYWEGRNESGELVGNGVYVYQLRAGGYSQARRMVIVK